jgi:6-phosphofructokinase 1
MNATLAGVVREAGAQAAVGQIFGLRHGIEGALSDDLIDLRRHDGRTLDLVARTPAAALGSSRHKVRDDDLEPTLRTFRAHDVRYFLLIGGNDSMDTCHRIVAAAEQSNYALTVVGVPKTIDNDLPVTDHCPGYGSAARFVALAAMSVGVDLEAMSTFDDVSILETMGRNTGWLAAASVLGKRGPADPPHLICLPERVFDEAAFLDRVRRAHETYGQVLCVVAEGLRDAGGRFVGISGQDARTDRFGHTLVTLTSGVGYYLAGRIAESLGLQARSNRPGTLQRSAWMALSTTDYAEAEGAGRAAVRCATGGMTDVMITLDRVSSVPYACEFGTTPLDAVANRERRFPEEWIAPDGSGTTAEFVDYALPLVGDALPEYGRLGAETVPRRARRAVQREGG